MNKAKLRAASLIARIALASATVYCSVAVAGSASGGVIYFTGALVASPFDISVGHTAGLRVSTAAEAHMTDTSGRTTYVTFLPDAHNPPNAELQLSAASAGAVSATFRDGRGRLVKPDAAGTYRVGALGGTLSMRPGDDTSPSATQVTLTTTYR